MKKLAGILLMLLVAATGCQEEQITAWALTSQSTDLTARVGVENDNVEIGAVAKYANSAEIEWGPEPDYAGGYLIFHLTQDVTIEDTPDPSPLKDFLEALHAKPYAGLEILGEVTGSQRSVQPNWIAGTTFSMSEDANWFLVTEYVDGDQASGEMHVGIMGRF